MNEKSPQKDDHSGSVRCPACDEVAMWVWTRATGARFYACESCGYMEDQ